MEVDSVAGVWMAWTKAKIGLGGLYATGTVWTLERRQDREGLDRSPRRQDRDGLGTERRQDLEGWDSGGHKTGTVWTLSGDRIWKVGTVVDTGLGRFGRSSSDRIWKVWILT